MNTFAMKTQNVGYTLVLNRSRNGMIVTGYEEKFFVTSKLDAFEIFQDYCEFHNLEEDEVDYQFISNE